MYKITLVFLLVSMQLFAKQRNTFNLGLATLAEVKMDSYEKDPNAYAVVLHEEGKTYHDQENRSISLITDYYVRIKILNKNAFYNATKKIFFYKGEKIFNIRGVTYNISDSGAIEKTPLELGNTFTKDIGKDTYEVSFTLPNVKEGSVIEYKYSLRSPNFGYLRDWNFQSDIPKIKSVYNSSILGNWKYNVRIQGYLKLDVDKPTLEKKCVILDGYDSASCTNLYYEIHNIPAFKREKYMSSERNFKSRLIFDLISYTAYEYKENVTGYTKGSGLKKKVTNYTKTWKDAEKTLRKEFLENELYLSRFFKNKLPANIFEEKTSLKKAQETYKFIQNHYNWNSKYISYGKNLKKSYNEKVGSVDVINLSLYNSLQAIGIESYPVVLATRAKGLPTDLFPVVEDFNYVIVKAVINGKKYFLDAKNKYLSFGQVSFECLNGKVRVLDFDKGSYWEGLTISDIYSTSTKLNLVLTEDNVFEGEMTILSKGYKASDKRLELDTTSEEQYLEKIESDNPYLEIGDYKPINKNNLDETLQEKFEVRFYDDTATQKNQRINPFFNERFTENPFKLSEREYPVDFGIPINYSYLLNLKIPTSYKVVSIPEELRIKLPNNGGIFMLKSQKKEGNVNIFMRYSLSKPVYTSAEYNNLKDFFNQIIKAQNSFIEIKPN